MKKLYIFVILFSNLLYSQTIYIKYKQNTPKSSIKLQELKKKLGNNRKAIIYKSLADIFNIQDTILSQIFVIKSVNYPADSIISQISSDNNVEYIAVPKKITIDKIDSKTPNDIYFSKQWYINKIKALDALNYASQDTVLIGVIDTGIDFNHPDLKKSIFYNFGEMGIDSQGRDKRFNGVDDDGNGFIDDYFGYDFVNRFNTQNDTINDFSVWDNYPLDEHGHGTAVTGVIAATVNNSIGIAGINPYAKILNLRAFDKTGNGNEDDVAAAIIYAVKMGCKIINMSFGDDSYSLLLRDVIRFAYLRGVTLVASAGNKNSSIPHYPSFFQEVISVGASNEQDNKASFSNYGTRIDLVAPGTNIYSTTLNNSYDYLNGTSFAAPIVSAVAGLLKSKYPNLSPDEIKNILKITANDISKKGADNETGSGRLNALNALKFNPSGFFEILNPKQDFSYSSDTVWLNYSIMYPSHISHSIYLGIGTNPKEWQSLSENLTAQGFNLQHPIITKNLADTTYTLKIQINTNNSNYQNFVNFSINKKDIEIIPIFLAPIISGSSVGFAVSAYTNKKAILKVYFKKSNESDFKSIILTPYKNVAFKQNLHFGKYLDNTLANSQIQFYFEATDENQTFVENNNEKYYKLNLPEREYPNNSNTLLNLPFKSFYNSTINFSNKQINIGYKDNSSYFFDISNNSVKILDSLPLKINIIDDLDNDGKLEIIGRNATNFLIYKQINNNELKFVKIYEAINSYYPAAAYDLNKDNQKEIFIRTKDTTFTVFNLIIDKLEKIADLNNFSPPKYFTNTFRTPELTFGDFNKDGNTEIFAIDGDGDILCWQYQNNQFTKLFYYETDFYSQGNIKFIDNKLLYITHTVDYDVVPLYFLTKLEFIQPNQIQENILKVFYDDNRDFLLNNDIGLQLLQNYLSVSLPMEFYIFENSLLENSSSITTNYDFLSSKKERIIKNNQINSNLVYFNNISNGKFFIFNNEEELIFSESNSSNAVLKKIDNQKYKLSDIKLTQLNKTTINLSWQPVLDTIYIFKSYNKINWQKIILNNTSDYNDTISYQTVYYSINSINYLNSIHQIAILPETYIKKYKTEENGSLIIEFNNPIDFNSLTPENITITDNKIKISSVGKVNNNTLIINFIKFSPNISYKINNLSIIDINNRKYTFDDIAFNFPVTNKKDLPFYIKSYNVLSDYSLSVNFNKQIDINKTQDNLSIDFIPFNTIDNTTITDSSIIIKVKSNPLTVVGLNTKITLNGIISLSGDTLSSFANQIYINPTYNKDKEIIVFPNPVILKKHNKITFSNLPEKYTIYIMGLDGTIQNTIEGNTPYIEWDLKNNNSSILGTGIYLYKIYIKSSTTINEIKNGKIAIIR